VLVAAAEPLLAQGIAALIAEHPFGAAPVDAGQRLTALEAVSSLSAAERALGVYRPPLAVLVLDPPLSGGSTEDACARLIDAYPATASLVLLAGATPACVRRVCQSGARGVFETNIEPGTLVAALHQIDAGEVVVPPTLIQHLLGNAGEPAAPPRSPERLNARALTALQLLARGYASKEIAPILGTTPKAVNLTIERACRQLGAATRSAAVVIAIQRGLIS
jgi:DNA-binding NarL/FixJ family response regulator